MKLIMNMIDIWMRKWIKIMDEKPAGNYCKGCEFYDMVYDLDDRQYYFGCASTLTCDKIKEKELDKNDRSASR